MKHRTDYYDHKWQARKDWQAYEYKKAMLQRKGLSPREYEIAIRKLSRECGV
jgi:hypothetical protein